MAYDYKLVDFVAKSKSNLSSQFQKENFLKIAELIGTIKNKVQDDQYRMIFYSYIENSFGYQLDLVGKIWNVGRSGETDVLYRRRIKKSSVLQVSGTYKELVTILKDYFNGSFAEVSGVWSEDHTTIAQYKVVSDADITLSELERFSVAGVGVGLTQNFLVSKKDRTQMVAKKNDEIKLTKKGL